MGKVKGNCLQQVNAGLGRSGREVRRPEGPRLLLEPLQVSTDWTTALKAPKRGKKKKNHFPKHEKLRQKAND